MPTYEYQCDACEHRFELFQSMTAAAVRKCPKCRKLKVRRLISGGGGIIFRGSGFYITDYRPDSYKQAASKETSPSSSSSSTSSSPSETKAADAPKPAKSTKKPKAAE